MLLLLEMIISDNFPSIVQSHEQVLNMFRIFNSFSNESQILSLTFSNSILHWFFHEI